MNMNAAPVNASRQRFPSDKTRVYLPRPSDQADKNLLRREVACGHPCKVANHQPRTMPTSS